MMVVTWHAGQCQRGAPASRATVRNLVMRAIGVTAVLSESARRSRLRPSQRRRPLVPRGLFQIVSTVWRA